MLRSTPYGKELHEKFFSSISSDNPDIKNLLEATLKSLLDLFIEDENSDKVLQPIIEEEIFVKRESSTERAAHMDQEYNRYIKS